MCRESIACTLQCCGVHCKMRADMLWCGVLCRSSRSQWMTGRLCPLSIWAGHSTCWTHSTRTLRSMRPASRALCCSHASCRCARDTHTGTHNLECISTLNIWAPTQTQGDRHAHALHASTDAPVHNGLAHARSNEWGAASLGCDACARMQAAVAVVSATGCPFRRVVTFS